PIATLPIGRTSCARSIHFPPKHSSVGANFGPATTVARRLVGVRAIERTTRRAGIHCDRDAQRPAPDHARRRVRSRPRAAGWVERRGVLLAADPKLLDHLPGLQWPLDVSLRDARPAAGSNHNRRLV